MQIQPELIASRIARREAHVEKQEFSVSTCGMILCCIHGGYPTERADI